MPDPNIPPGSSHNPSAWSHRAPLIGLALVGCGIAAYLSCYQLRLISGVWDPFFGRGSEAILTSWVSRALPVPDASLGAAAYLLDAITGAIGDQARWRTMPWMVLAFGLVVAGLVVTGLGLVLAQVLLFHTGCTLCLASAAISFASGWLARDEVLASVRYLRRARGAGQALGRVLRNPAEPSETSSSGPGRAG
jgi:uncharacterized membrane protein